MTRRYWVVLVCAAAIVLSACGGGPGGVSSPSPKELQKIDFQLSFTPFPQNVAYYVAQAKGFYAEQGLDVNILRGNGSAATATNVDQGQVVLGESDLPSVVVGRSKGQRIKSFLVMVDSTPQAFASVNPAIRTPKDFEGHTVGVAPGTGDANLLPVLVKVNGGDPAKVKVQNLQPGVYIPSVLNGQVDVAPAYLNGGFISLKIAAEKAGKTAYAIAARDFNLDTYQLCVIASEKTLQEKPDLVRAFTKATVKGLQYTVGHADEAVQILQKAIPTLDPATTPLQLAEVIKIVDTSGFRSRGFGVADDQKLMRTRDIILQAYGVSATMALTDIHTNDFAKAAK